MYTFAPKDPLVQRYEFILEHTREFLTVINRSYVYELVNSSYCAALGKSRDEVLGHTVAEVWGADRFENSIKIHLERSFNGEHVAYVQSFQFGAQKRYMHVNYYPFYEAGGQPTHVLVSSHDITHLGELEGMLANYEYRDPVTGLFNRKSLDVLLEMELLKAQSSSQTQMRALLFIGIENLPQVSRRYGYDIGDHVLENTGIRVRESIRTSDYVFRVQGNELAVILCDIGEEADVERIATKITQTVSTPYRLREAEIGLACRAGAAVYPFDASTSDHLIRNAAGALAEAVRDGKCFKRFDRTVRRLASRRLTMEGSLRRAFEGEQFELYFQPIVQASGRVEGAEALLRWNLPQRGIVRPAEFLPIAEENGMMEAISRWAIFAAIREIARISDRFPTYLTVNMTAQDFESDDLLRVLETALAQTEGRVSPSHLKLEITETDAMRRPDRAIPRIELLQRRGFEVFVDDFGTGHSSLAYLRTLPANAIKIDKDFVDALADEGRDEPFVRYIVELIKIKGKKVIAEGVSRPEQVERLKAMGCDSFQGYYFAEPLPVAAFETFLERSFRPLRAGGR